MCAVPLLLLPLLLLLLPLFWSSLPVPAAEAAVAGPAPDAEAVLAAAALVCMTGVIDTVML